MSEQSWRCLFGIHQWHNTGAAPSIAMGFPASSDSRKWTRRCLRCGKEQWWLPGYGGSEWGCWLRLRRRNR